MLGIDDVLFGLAAKYLVPLAGDYIGSLFSDDDSKKTARTVTKAVAGAAIATAAKATGITLTDETSFQQASAQLKADPTKLLDYQKSVNEQALTVMAEETKRLAVINETIRAEVTSGDPYVRRMRPTFGYVMAATWGLQMAAVSYTVAFRPEMAAGVLNGVAATTTLWGIGLAVLGVYVYKRSSEKGAPSGLVAPLGKLVGGGK